MMHRILNRQEGYALITATALMAVMLTLGLSTFALVDGGSKRSREQREQESAINLAEGVLYAQALVLAREWPAGAKSSYPRVCANSTQTTAPEFVKCPNPASLSASDAGGTSNVPAAFRSADFLANGQWTVKVRDDYGPLEGNYDASQADLPLSDPTDANGDGVTATCGGTTALPYCTRDFDGDRQLWVHARTNVRGEVRNVVALLKLELLSEDVPRASVSAGAMMVSNNNNTDRPTVVGGEGGVYVRCETSSPNCASYRTNSKTGKQDVEPPPETDKQRPPLMTYAQLVRMRERAKTDNRYYQGCPTKDPVTGKYDLSGAVVWVEGCAASPSFSNDLVSGSCGATVPDSRLGTSCINTIQKPGMLIWHCGAVSFTGNSTFVGLIYMVNASDSSVAGVPASEKCETTAGIGPIGNGLCVPNDTANVILQFGGNFSVWGAVSADGSGCFVAGSNGVQVYYDRNVFNAIASYGTAGLVQNTWRELPGNAAF